MLLSWNVGKKEEKIKHVWKIGRMKGNLGMVKERRIAGRNA